MDWYERRLHRRMKNPEFRTGYLAMDAALCLLHAIDDYRENSHISIDELAQRMGRNRESVSRILKPPYANSTLSTLVAVLAALGVTADITLRKAQAGEAPIKVAIADSPDQQTSSQ